eukprot:3963385-Amphidinium_carterae.1
MGLGINRHERATCDHPKTKGSGSNIFLLPHVCISFTFATFQQPVVGTTWGTFHYLGRMGSAGRMISKINHML